MGDSNNQIPRLYIPKLESGIWVPPGSRVAHDAQTELLQDSGIWIHSSDSYYALQSRLRTLPIDEFLALVSRASYLRAGRNAELADVIQSYGREPEIALRNYQLAYLVKLILEDFDRDVDRAWPTDDDTEKFRLLERCTHLASNVLPRVGSIGDQSEDGYSILLKIAYQQFNDFEPLRNLYPRGHYIFREYAREAEKVQGITLGQILKEDVGLDIEEAMFLTFGFYSLLWEGKRGHLLSRDFMTDSKQLPGITPEIMGNLLDWLSADYEKFRSRAREWHDNPYDHALYSFNPVYEYPFIKTPTDQYVIPVAHCLFRRVTTGLFYDLIRSRNHGGAAGRIIGRAIELYVRRLINDLPVHGRVIPEQVLSDGRVTCEWILDEPEATILIECKRMSLSQRAKTTGLLEDIKASVSREDSIADGVAKLQETAAELRKGNLTGVNPDERIVGLLITLDQFFMANDGHVREAISGVLTDRGIDIDTDYQICSLPDFETLCRYLSATETTLSGSIVNKLSGQSLLDMIPETKRWDFQMWVTHIWPKDLEAQALPSSTEFYDEVLPAMVERFKPKA